MKTKKFHMTIYQQYYHHRQSWIKVRVSMDVVMMMMAMLQQRSNNVPHEPSNICPIYYLLSIYSILLRFCLQSHTSLPYNLCLYVT
jgi:hypothetical protein